MSLSLACSSLKACSFSFSILICWSLLASCSFCFWSVISWFLFLSSSRRCSSFFASKALTRDALSAFCFSRSASRRSARSSVACFCSVRAWICSCFCESYSSIACFFCISCWTVLSWLNWRPDPSSTVLWSWAISVLSSLMILRAFSSFSLAVSTSFQALSTSFLSRPIVELSS